MKYICDCMGNSKEVYNKISQGRGLFKEVPVNDDATCKYCGHYAVSFRELGYTRGNPTVFGSLALLYGEMITQDKQRRQVSMPVRMK